ncbi:hypothetical protein QOZ84_00455 [Romboutsia sedimentorum]|uniref:Uncharacterized protein n=1 Tax=Romboutsia sedimentorum TaxID=1368474 RepID=A0ABT7E514_9FIRM|nr:hypothetical protein [Romboutsia sedimentorum]MDK2562001.1 hypothetical protein [Romboutsia sedimentorum]MDK2584240.1 hypothetical protein [Romboutsia sedimentorum]
MIFKKISIIFSIILIIFANSSNVSFAATSVNIADVTNEYIKSLEIIDNYMHVLMKSISTANFNEAQINKDIKFVETLINDLNSKTSKLTESDNDVILAMQVILNYYKISIINTKNFLNTKDADSLISAISSFSLGYDSSSSLRTIIGKVR